MSYNQPDPAALTAYFEAVEAAEAKMLQPQPMAARRHAEHTVHVMQALIIAWHKDAELREHAAIRWEASIRERYQAWRRRLDAEREQ